MPYISLFEITNDEDHKIQFFNDLPRKTENLVNKLRVLYNAASGS